MNSCFESSGPAAAGLRAGGAVQAVRARSPGGQAVGGRRTGRAVRAGGGRQAKPPALVMFMETVNGCNRNVCKGHQRAIKVASRQNRGVRATHAEKVTKNEKKGCLTTRMLLSPQGHHFFLFAKGTSAPLRALIAKTKCSTCGPSPLRVGFASPCVIMLLMMEPSYAHPF